MDNIYNIRDFLEFDEIFITEELKTNLDIRFEDGVVTPMLANEIKIQRYILSLWEILKDYPIKSSFCIKNFYVNEVYSARTLNNCFEKIIEDFIKSSNNFNKKYIIEHLWAKMYSIFSDIYNNILSGHPEYYDSINIVDLLEVQLRPELVDAIKKTYKEKTSNSVKNTYDVLDNILRNDPKFKNKSITLGYLSGSFNPSQVRQILGSRGYVSDIDDSIYKLPIPYSYTFGMQDLYSLAVESRSAPKALTANNNAVPMSEYFSRELQLLSMYIERLVPGDCGSKNYISWMVRENDLGKSDIKNLVGKRYYNEETGTDDLITEEHSYLKGKTIKLRSPLGCCLPNRREVCEYCFGNLFFSVPTHSNIGHLSAAVLGQALTQNILKTKHITGSLNSKSIVLNDITNNIFIIKPNNAVFFRKEFLKKTLKIKAIIEQSMAQGLKDIMNIDDVKKINVNRVSYLYNFILEISDKKGNVNTIPVSFSSNKKAGSFSYEALEYIKKQGIQIDDEDRYTIDLSDFGAKEKIIILPDSEESLLNIVSKLRIKLRSLKSKRNSGEYSEPESLLQELFDILNSKLDINLAHLEIITLSFFINSLDGDYRVNRNSSTGGLTSNLDIISHRSLGNGYGWEKIIKLILSPSVFNGKNNISHPLDVLLRPNEVLENEGSH